MKKLIVIIILSLISTFNAGYLTINAYKLKNTLKTFNIQDINSDRSLTSFVCDINSTFSCSSVFSHDFSRIFSIPFSVLALFVYPTIIILSILAIKGKIKNIYKILAIIASMGILFNGYIIINEIIVGVYCILCLICTAIIISILAMSIHGIIKSKKILKK